MYGEHAKSYSKSQHLFVERSAALTAKEYSFQQKYNCPLVEKCLPECLIYHGQLDKSDINQTKNYYITCEKNFKERYDNHTASFRNKNKKVVPNFQNISGGCKIIAEITTLNLKWSIACKTHPYTGGIRKCDLCLIDKLSITS